MPQAPREFFQSDTAIQAFFARLFFLGTRGFFAIDFLTATQFFEIFSRIARPK